LFLSGNLLCFAPLVKPPPIESELLSDDADLQPAGLQSLELIEQILIVLVHLPRDLRLSGQACVWQAEASPRAE
jgi:hypothetical protein